MTVRFKLTMAFIAVILVANSVLSLVTVKHVGRVWLEEVQTRVRLDLNSARASYNNHLDGIVRFLQAASLHRVIAAGAAKSNREEMVDRLQKVYRNGGMDIVSLIGPDGRVLYRAQNPQISGDDLSANPLIEIALKKRSTVAGTVILSAEDLEKEGYDLVKRARFKLLLTPKARPTTDEYRTDGMVVAAAIPILDSQGELLGVLYGGDLLNRRYTIVDAIKDEVFAHEIFEGKDIGTVTIFQGDLRISTNVTKQDGTRAVGTRLSDVVYKKVLDQGGIWADRAFVVNDWYITAYEPIRDPTEKIIGALYVGLLEAPFAHKQTIIIGVFLVIVLATTLASLVLLFFVTKLVLRPIGQITTMSRKVVDGDLRARVGIRPPGEMGVLCQAIDAMADAVEQREEQLKLATRQQIGRSEKLASIGRLAAGIAHEINNPLTGVLTFAHLLRQKENMDEQDKQDLDLIINETTRAGEIVRGLLDFARERPAVKEPLEINEVITQTLRLIRGQKQFEQIIIEEKLNDNVPRINGDMNQLQQVLLNLSLNACEAMSDGGTLTISTESQNNKAFVKVTDNGSGIKKEHLDQIFEPFFSTKPAGKGTGLGLSVSYGIIQQHGGNLEVESQEGKGTTFTIILPCVSESQTDHHS
ncbi:MAG: cache domain-containing protein [Planctomycetota bacterium]|nr:MAG: cache domain-containing protein [Planctomycetota bacterium]